MPAEAASEMLRSMAPCTRAVAPGEAPRAGRGSGTGKTECGIHTRLPPSDPFRSLRE